MGCSYSHSFAYNQQYPSMPMMGMQPQFMGGGMNPKFKNMKLDHTKDESKQGSTENLEQNTGEAKPHNNSNVGAGGKYYLNYLLIYLNSLKLIHYLLNF